MSASEAIVKSAIPGITWPALPPPEGAAMLAVQFQLEQSQWWSPEQLLEHQLRQLQTLLIHSYKTVPFYRERLLAAGFNPGNTLTAELFRNLPILYRRDIQTAGKLLLSTQLPPDHGKIYSGKTSGSTGRPIQYSGTELAQFWWRTMTLREHLWHQRDFAGKLAIIRVNVRSGEYENWGSPAATVFQTGGSVTLDIGTDLNIQLAWLKKHNPDYLLSYPSNVLALANACISKGIRLENLREVRTIGEALNPELRSACREAWGAPVTDTYSANEVGYIAFQCPGHEHYHIQSETMFVEILNDQGATCQPGETGRIVLTPLLNYAMPLIRYEIMDYAEAGTACPCGRGLPVIRRILGRQRNLIHLPDGSQHWPSTGYNNWMGIAPIEQIQLVQKSLHDVEARLVMPRPLTPDEQKRMVPILQKSLGYAFQISFSYHHELCRNASGKFEDFISEAGKNTSIHPDKNNSNSP
jgi:phenylacetate-CoA ligase